MRGTKNALLAEIIDALEAAGVERDPMVFDGIDKKLTEQEMWQVLDLVLELCRKVTS
ncbi:hypothetical protein [Bacillus sp. FJAT-26390]|uniref:hypothetical protein n=1 Tax=Bacillus sp. FJAT-26390 TaxID=1743142 RepID=UPI00159EC736|nr:hypothetical protein [Bacillus sp. FJAT-26390]